MIACWVVPWLWAELGIAVNLWDEGWGLLVPSDRRRASDLTLELAEEIDKYKQPENRWPARLATRVAQSYEEAEEWDLAQDAQKQAIEYYKTAKSPERIKSQADACLEKLAEHQPCNSLD